MKQLAVNGFRGIDERLELAHNLDYASRILNLRVTDDYSLEKRRSVTQVFDNETDNIDGIWSGMLGGEEYVMLAYGGYLHRYDSETGLATNVGYIGNGKCSFFVFNGYLYIKNNTYYCKFGGISVVEVNGYIPCIAISCDAGGGGTLFEQLNCLTGLRRQKFSADGSSLTYKLAETGIQYIDYIMQDGVEYQGQYTLNASAGSVTFPTPPQEGLNNLEICYCIRDSQRELILHCTNAMMFGGNSDGRIFLWGNADYPNYRFHSELADGLPSVEYFPANNYTVIGNTTITCIVQQYDRQLIFTEDKAYYSYCELKEDTTGNVYSSFPVYSLNSEKGCLIKTEGCVIDNKPVTLCRDGLNMWESTSVENEKNALCFSGRLRRSLRNIASLTSDETALLDLQVNRELFLLHGGFAYIYNYGNDTFYVYDDFAFDSAASYGSVIYITRGSALYAFSDNNDYVANTNCVWESPDSTFGEEYGRIDISECVTDAYLKGPILLTVKFSESGNGCVSEKSLFFSHNCDKKTRISMRPAVKRAMPLKLSITLYGSGSASVYGLTVKTKNRGRSDRNGIF